MPILLRLIATAFVFLLFAGPASSQQPPQHGGTQLGLAQQKIKHVIVIYEENWSFDSLYAYYRDANGARSATTGSQLQCPMGGTADDAPLTANPPALIVAGNPTGPWPCGWQGLSNPSDANFATDKNIPTGLPVQPFDVGKYDPAATKTGDLWHIFWHEQLQIDNGKLEPSNGSMDKFIEYSSNPGLVLSFYRAEAMVEGRIARHYTMADNFFHSVYGGSFLNHQWLICACTPVWNQPLPTSNVTTFESYWNGTSKTLNDGNLTTMPMPQTSPGPQAGVKYYVVNTTLSTNLPRPGAVRDQLLKPIPPTTKTIGDLLTDARPSVSWKWYAGRFAQAIVDRSAANLCATATKANATNEIPDDGPCFQWHHQPFAYYQRWAGDGSALAESPHLQDDNKYYHDLHAGTLPQVSFIKPVGVYNDHPGYSALAEGQSKLQSYIAALCKSKYWKDTALIITYDENGGRWDHVTPPKVDEWGLGTRVPAIIVSPYSRAGKVDSTQYETVSILAFIEKLFRLPSLNARDAHASPLLNAFDFTQAPLACQSS
jgi:acid phosphatase